MRSVFEFLNCSCISDISRYPNISKTSTNLNESKQTYLNVSKTSTNLNESKKVSKNQRKYLNESKRVSKRI